MRLLFLHQNFPAQFLRVALALRQSAGHDLLAVVPTTNARGAIIPMRTYPWQDPLPGPETLTSHVEACARRGGVVADALLGLKREGYVPDLIVGHPGWGETLFVRDVWPRARMLLHAEFFHRAEGFDTGFDPETAAARPELLARQVRMRASVMLASLAEADAAVTPTAWQASSFPPLLRPMLRVVHEGIDTDLFRPDPTTFIASKRDGVTLRPGDEVVTFVVRNLEHYRGFHVFMRALPSILSARPRARAVIVGGDEVSYGRRPPPGRTWRRVMLDELGGRLDLSRVHFVGRVPYQRFLQLMQVSAAHVYLTYPFVLSWSMLEAMSAGALVIGSRTGPVEEVIEHGRNGLLVDFFDGAGLAETVVAALAEPGRYAAVREAARRTIVERYDASRICVPAWLRLIEEVAGAG